MDIQYPHAPWTMRWFTRKADINLLKPNPLDEATTAPVGAIIGQHVHHYITNKKFYEPITVRRRVEEGFDGYEIVNGHHRWHAAKKMNLKIVPIHIVN
ncbi:ParB N-terminal domain-containing protein [Salinibius halmophilus]|uniref:ParB N-terminal domain-containing protein n=1 Tax=Salinibius halmophilus TaxID=1853216 RepID=UPI000E6725FF|nr:ParB N-terminal domain-containing protein [Salinibius halmophilus]